ncbi:MAG: glutamine--fructose-6-phosphate transaminase (isomerizing) [Candidatus Microgenomates bacterium]
MCGIFAILGDKNKKAAQTVLEGLKKLEYRGYDSWGIAAFLSSSSKKIEVEKHIGKIGEANTILGAADIAIGHTRWATHGGVTDFNAHPHLDCSEKIAVIHNGIVENYQIIKEKLLNKNHQFSSQTDTEVIVHLIEEKLKNHSLTDAVFDAFNEIIGSNAIGVMDLETQSIIACRNGSPLVIGIDEKNNQFFLGSDVPAFLKYTNKVYFLNDDEGIVINKNGLKLYDLKSKKQKPIKYQIIDWKLEDAEKAGYPHFLIKEINEQKQTIPKTVLINKNEIDKIKKLHQKGYQIEIIGCGSAYYCGLAGKYYFSLNNVLANVYGAYEYDPFKKFTNKKTLVLAISQSGETADTLIAVKNAKKNGAKIAAIVNARGSTLERLADIVVPVGAGPEIAVVSTKAFTAQLATLYLIANSLNNNYKLAVKKIESLGEILKKFLSKQLFDKIISLSKKIIAEEHAYVIGKHLNYPASLEFALKMKETSYLHAEAFAAGELKHGVITLIQKNTPCFVLASNDDVKDEVLSSAAQMKARGGKIIGIAPFESKEFDELIITPDTQELTIFANIIVGQLLGYYLGIGRGADPDKPRNLAKSVTVK